MADGKLVVLQGKKEAGDDEVREHLDEALGHIAETRDTIRAFAITVIYGPRDDLTIATTHSCGNHHFTLRGAVCELQGRLDHNSGGDE